MSSLGPSYLLGAKVEESPIEGKYYLQLADHSLLDLLREAVKSILIFNLPLEELPILHLQKEIFLIYDNRIIKEQDILDTIKAEIREAAKLQKKFLDMSFTYLEKEKHSLSDMRDPADDAWSLSWARHRAKDTDDSLKRAYGVVASLFCNNYATFVQSIREVSRLLDHLHRECLIPPIDTELLEESLLEIVMHQFFLQYNCLDLHKVLPIMAQSLKERFVYSSEFGLETRKKISKYTPDQSLLDIFMPKPQERPLPPPSPPEEDNKNELKQLMKEMFLKEFRNNEIISPFIFDEKGKLKLFDSDLRNDEDDLDQTEKEIARLTAKKVFRDQTKADPKLDQQLKKDPKPEEIKRDVKPEPKKDVKIEDPKKDLKKETKAEPLKSEPKPETKEKKGNPSPLKSDSIQAHQNAIKQAKAFQISLIKSESKKEETKAVKPDKPEPKEPKLELKEKSKSSNESIPIKEDKAKVVSESKLPIKQPPKQEKTGKKKEESPEPSKPASAHKEPTDNVQISTTKIVLDSSTTIEARVTSFTISAEAAERYAKTHKNISTDALIQLAKGYGQSQIKLKGFEDKPKPEEDEKEENEPEEPGKKKRKRKNKKKNKKSEEPKEELNRVKSESKVETERPDSSPQKEEPPKPDCLTEEERAICNSIESLEIDDKTRVECKVDEEMLSSWRRKFFALKKTFPK